VVRILKTIAVSDEVYRKLISIKGDRTFSQVIDELIRRDVERRVEKLIEVAASRPEGVEDLEEIVESIRKLFRVKFRSFY